MTAAAIHPGIRLRRNVISGYALQIAGYLIPLATLPFLVRTLGPTQYGRMAFAYSALFFAVLLVDAGFNTRAARVLAGGERTAMETSAVYAVTTWLKTFLAVLVLALLSVSAWVFTLSAEDFSLLLASYLIVLGSVAFPTWLFQGMEEMHHTTLCALGGRLLVTLGLFICVDGPDDLLPAATLQAAGTLASGLLALPVVRRLGLTLTPPRNLFRAEMRRALHESWRLGITEYASRVLANGGVFLLGLFVAGPMLGIFAAIEKLALALTTLQRPLLRALFPRVSHLWATDPAAAHLLCLHASRRLASGALVGSLLAMALAPAVLTGLFGDAIAAHADLLRILCLWMPAVMGSELIAQLWLIAPGHQDQYSRIGIPFTFLHSLALIAGAACAGATGLCIALAVGEALHCTLLALTARRLHSKEQQA